MVPISCHPTDWSPAPLQIWNQKMCPQAFPPALQQRKGGSFSQNALAWGRTRGTNQREQDPEELCLPQKLAPAARLCTWKICKLGSVCWSGSFYALDHYFLHKHLMKISKRGWCCQWRSFGLLWRTVNCDVKVVWTREWDWLKLELCSHILT